MCAKLMAFRNAADKLERIVLSILSKEENEHIDNDGDESYSASFRIEQREYHLFSNPYCRSMHVQNADKGAVFVFHKDRSIDVNVYGSFVQIPHFATAKNLEMDTMNELTEKMEEYAAELWPFINSTEVIGSRCGTARFCNEEYNHLETLRLI